MTRTLNTLRLVFLAGAAQLALTYAPSIVAGASITLTDGNCESFLLSGPPGNQTLTCVGSSAGGTAPSGCTLTPSQTPVTAGTLITLASSCNGGNAPTAWSWTGSGTQSSSLGPSQPVVVAGTTTFSVTPSNSGGNGNTASTTVTVSSSGGGSTGGGGTITACSGFTNTKVIEAVIPANGGANNRYFTSFSSVFSNGATSGFGSNDAIILRFTAPSSDAYFNIGMNETGTGATGAPSYRSISLSTKACDFDVPRSANSLWAYEDMGFSLNLSTDGTQRINLQPNATYYINIRNYAFGSPACSATRCDVFFTFSNPNP